MSMRWRWWIVAVATSWPATRAMAASRHRSGTMAMESVREMWVVREVAMSSWAVVSVSSRGSSQQQQQREHRCGSPRAAV